MNSKVFITIAVLISIILGTQQLTFSQDQTLKIEDDLFEMSLEDLLNQSVTTVSKSEERLLDAPGIISVLTKEEIEMFGATTLSSVLERIPGLSLGSASLSDRSIITSRGEQITSTSNHILLLINGRPVRETLEGGVNSEMYESFPIDVIDRIEVIKGPGSVLYGSNAFSGVINIITNEADQTELTLSGLTSFSGGMGASANLNVKAGDFKLVAVGQYLKKPEWETEYTYQQNLFREDRPDEDNGDKPEPEPGTGLPNDTPPGTFEATTSSISIPSEGIGAFVNASYKNFSLTSTYNQWESLGFIAPGTERWSKNFNNLGYDLNFTNKWNSTINVSLTNSTFETDSFPNTKRDSHEFLAEWTHNVSLTEKAKIVFGGLYSFSKGEETAMHNNYTGLEGQSYSYGAYAQADYQLLKSLKLTAGLQVNKYENIDPKLVPRIALVWNPTDHLNFKALYSEAFRAPSLMELNLDQPFRQGNSELEPETVGTLDLGISYHNDKYQIGCNFFHSSLHDIIAMDHSGDIPTYQNIGQVAFNGGELDAKFFFNKNFYFSTSALYQINENLEGDSNISPTSNFSAKAGLSYSTDLGISLGLFNIYQGKLDDKYASTINPTPIDSYNKLSLQANFDLKKLLLPKIKQDISIFINGENLLNQEIWSFSKSGRMNSSIPMNQGRTIYAGIKLKL